MINFIRKLLGLKEEPDVVKVKFIPIASTTSHAQGFPVQLPTFKMRVPSKCNFKYLVLNRRILAKDIEYKVKEDDNGVLITFDFKLKIGDLLEIIK